MGAKNKHSVGQMKILFVFVFLLLCFSVFSQNFKKDFNAYIEASSKRNDIWMEVNYTSFDSLHPLGRDVAKFIYKKKGANCYMGFMNKEIIVRGEKMLLIDDEDKLIRYNGNYHEKEKPKDYAQAIEKFLKITDTIVFVGKINGKKKYVLYPKTGYGLAQMEITFDGKNKMIEKIMEIRLGIENLDPKKTLISFHYFEESKLDENKDFLFENVIIEKVDGVTLNKAYIEKNYRLEIVSK